MTASFPTTIKSFTAVTDGVDYPEAVDINSLQEEVTAIGTLVGAAASKVQIYNLATENVSTAATILSFAGSVAVKMVVVGINNAFDKAFMDTVISFTSGSFTVLDPTTLFGSPGARTYTWSGNNVQLAMASDTYDIKVSAQVFR